MIEVPLEGIEIEILYFFLNFTFIRDVIEESVYCEQSLHIECFDDATFEVNANSAWQSADGTYQEYWAGNTGKLLQLGTANRKHLGRWNQAYAKHIFYNNRVNI